MYLDGLDEIDQKIITLLIENARYTYSEIGDRLGLSRVAIKNHIDALEAQGIIEEYTTIINPQKLGGAVSCYFEIETSPSSFTKVIQLLCDCPTVTQIYRSTGKCRLHVHAVAANHDELEGFLSEVIDKLPDIVSISTNVILSSIKDIKGLRL